MQTKERLMLKYAVGGIVLSTSLHSAALSLGGHSGQAIIGRPLDIQVRSADPLADIESAGCLQAQVAYGDTQLPGSAVFLGVQSVAAGALIRVRANVPVNEPVVAVTLSTGCSSAERFSRKYTLLADLDPALATAAPAALPVVVLSPTAPPSAAPPIPPAAEPAAAPYPVLPPAPAPAAVALPPPPPVAAPPARPPAASAPAAPRAERPRQPRPARRAEAPRPAARAAAPRPAARAQAPAPRKAAASAPAPAPAPAPAVAAAGPRLKLDPIDLSPGRHPGLKLNTELLSAPSETHRQAASELWAALNTPPDKAAEDARRLAAMEGELKALREQQAALQTRMAALTAQFEQEREQSAPKSLVYALGGALALAVAALLWMLSERRKARRLAGSGGIEQPWWQSSQLPAQRPATPAPVPAVAPAMASAVAPVAAVMPVPVPMPASAPTPDEALAALEVSEASESSFVQPMDMRPISVEHLLDLHQQVEFFQSLRQEAEAASLVQAFIDKHPGACELPYLLSLQAAAASGDAQRLAAAAERYQRDLGLPAPDASRYAADGAGLDGQAKFMDVLARFWPREEAQDLLGNTLLAPPGTGLLETHSLAAYEDALLLHGLLQTLRHDGELRPPEAVPTTEPEPAPARRPVEMAGWDVPAAAATAATQTAQAPTPAPDQPTGPAPEMTLDLDLSFLDEATAAEPAPAPTPAPTTGRELPMLDFDLFALEPREETPDGDKNKKGG